MQIGCLGDIIFEVSDSVIMTVEKLSWSGSANISEHDVHLGATLTEFTGSGADSISITIKLAQYLGVDVQEQITKIKNYERSGTTLPLVIGTKGYGRYRWLIKSDKVSMSRTDRSGNYIEADVTLSLIEYIRGSAD